MSSPSKRKTADHPIAQRYGAAHDRFEHGLDVGRRLADHAQDLAGRRPLLEGLGQRGLGAALRRALFGHLALELLHPGLDAGESLPELGILRGEIPLGPAGGLGGFSSHSRALNSRRAQRARRRSGEIHRGMLLRQGRQVKAPTALAEAAFHLENVGPVPALVQEGVVELAFD
jgi:hypothetical protein